MFYFILFKNNYGNEIYTCTIIKINITKDNKIYFEYVDNSYFYGEKVITINEFKRLIKYKEI
jgi:hypothetical protein